MPGPEHDSEEAAVRGELFEFVFPAEREGQRLDHFLVEMLPDVSRSRINVLIRKSLIHVNNWPSKASHRLKEGDRITVTIPPPEPLEIRPEKVDFSILYEDEDLLVIAKPPGVVVHPASGHKNGTLVHGLVAHCRDLSGISGVERPGIVHRLDKDTSGVMVIAKNDRSHHGLVELFKSRQVKKVYHAIVRGRPENENGCISRPIGRHRSNRKMMAVLTHGGKEAVTAWSVLEELPFDMTYLEVRPETGRTHQIRVHMSFSGYPVAGDKLYGGGRLKVAEGITIERQCLHAYSLAFKHPVSGEEKKFIAPLWQDMQIILERLRQIKSDR